MIKIMPSFAAFLLVALPFIAGCVDGTDTPIAMFVFGDSYADTGNRNKFDTNLNQPWTAPYGYTWPGKPAGRFSDGKILTDNIASFLKISSPLPYRNWWFHFCHFPSGINFAFGGSGIFETYGPEYPTLSAQIYQFEMILKRCPHIIELINSSVVLLVVVGNDYIAYLQKNPSNPEGLTLLIPKVVSGIAASINELYNIGFRTFAIANLEPAGCTPYITSENNHTKCDETMNELSKYHNKLLSDKIAEISDLAKIRIINLNQYESFRTTLEKFDNNLEPCCKGLNNSTCGDVDELKKPLYTVCSNPETAFFWDDVHPTQAGWKAVSETYKDLLNFTEMHGQLLDFEA